ncbi:MAG: nicotinate (nicotinamide) nucleotide adenylyltransferase [Spirochaetaceae bacterium]|jgi:nicotinate-nucleotide adenylyltransferase|nr:nicotinate (nicotinamide) nucleotide adenylyltransferase [Spirochaetaceae bacterium]
MKLAMFGGSFNPVHIGHLFLAEEVRVICGYDLVLFIPAYISPFKPAEADGRDTAGRSGSSVPSINDRLAMIELAIAGNEQFRLERCEVDRGGISYTYDTLQYVLTRFGERLDEPPGLIIGDDLVADFGLWRRAAELAEQSRIIVARRSSIEMSSAEGHGFGYPHRTIENVRFPVSSSDIRERIKKGKGWRYLVPQEVYRYICERNLYEY